MRDRQIAPLMSLCLGVIAGCASPGRATLEPLGPRYAVTVWESIEIIRAGSDLQRTFVPLALVREDGTSRIVTESTVMGLQRQAARVGANAIVLDTLGSDGAWAGGGASGWGGVATAIRILDGRWADRYWRYGASPGALQRRADPSRSEVAEATDVGWQRVLSWSGIGVQETEPFRIEAEEWRVSWEATTDDERGLQILVYLVPGDVLAARIDQDGVGTGSYLGLAGGGTFYLTISGEAVSWDVAVEVWPP